MLGYFENSAQFYLPQIDLLATPLLGNLRENYLHWQDSVEIVCVLRGSVTVEVEGAAYLLQPGDVLTIDAFQHHRYAGGSADGLQLMLTIDDRMLYRQPGEHYTLATVGAGALPKEEPVFTTLRKSIGRICQLLLPLKKLMIYEGKAPAISGQVAHEALMETHRVCMILSAHTQITEKTVQPIPEEFLRCIQFIHEHYGENCSAPEVAHACGFSERSLRRLFQQYMGQSFNKYLTTIRLIAARSLLENTDCSVTDAAAAVGLSTSSFYRVFREATGMSPKAYLEKLRRGDTFVLSPIHLSVPLLSRNIFMAVEVQSVDWERIKRGEIL